MNNYTPEDLLAVANQQTSSTGNTSEQDALWPEIRNIIETRMTHQPRDLQKEIGPSQLGTPCLHCLAAQLAGWPQHRQPAWLPFIGTCVHARLEQWFTQEDQTCEDGARRFYPELRVTVGRLQGLRGGYDIHGSIDLYDRETGSTIDWKIVGNTTITKTRAHGASQQYQVQASLYGIGLQQTNNPITSSCIYFLPKNKPTLADALIWQQPFDPRPGLWALSRAQLIVTLLDCIERADGDQVRDSWIHHLPTAPDECFQCRSGVWPDQQIPEGFDAHEWATVPDKWLRLIEGIDSKYTTNTTN